MSEIPKQKPAIDLRIPIPIIATILVQTSAFVYWASTWKADLTGRVTTIEQWMSQNNELVERVTRVEEKVTTLKEQGSRIEGKLDDALKQGSRQ